jgi:predicted adenine nucleotide alpha hydrolase (AANH) superfamily ATPase
MLPEERPTMKLISRMTEGTPLLVHVCCAPDAAYGLFALAEAHPVTAFFFNPNIDDPEEYRRRLDATRALASARPFPLVVGSGGEEEFAAAALGREEEPERGERCEACIRLRLARTAREAASLGFPAFATVLTVSPKKKAPLVNRIGREEGRKAGVPFLECDMKKGGGFDRSVEEAERLGLYRQAFCGCRYSIGGKLKK